MYALPISEIQSLDIYLRIADIPNIGSINLKTQLLKVKISNTIPYQLGRPQSSLFLNTRNLISDPPTPTRYMLRCILS
jgi:hypothetical protein